MHQLSKAGLIAGLASLVIRIISRVTMTPVMGIESSAIVEFAKVCFVLSAAASLAGCKK